MGIQEISGLETAYHTRQAVIFREKGKAVSSDDSGHMPGAEKAVYCEVIRLDEGADGRLCPFLTDTARKNYQASGCRLKDTGGGSGRGCLETDLRGK